MFWEVLAGFDPAVLASFVLAGLVLNITPGVDFAYVASSGISGGPRLGMAAACGINIGVLIHILMAAGGISALLIAYPSAYQAIQLLGAAWLVWLAYKAWTSASVATENEVPIS